MRVTTFVIKWIGNIFPHRNPLGIFRSSDCGLTPVIGADDKLELSISLNGEAINPKYILETPTPEKLRAFLKKN